MMVLVTGATGIAGREVVRALLERGRSVRAFVRDAEQARDRLGDAVELAVGDLAEPRTFRAALADVDELVLSCADDPRRVAWETGAIDAAAELGVRRVVRLSSIGAAPGAPVAFWDWHGRIDAHLVRSGLPAVILRPGPYMSNVLAAAEPVAHEGRLHAPAGEARMALIDPRDVGAAAAAAVTDAGHDGRTFVLTGPAAITYADVAAELSAATGAPVAFIDLPDQDAVEALAGGGMPRDAAEQVVALFTMLRRGAAEQVTDAVETLTGRPPRDLAAFVRDHADRFAPVPLGAPR
jgi:uncharacterized protein YbjT (DUF2867 family)